MDGEGDIPVRLLPAGLPRLAARVFWPATEGLAIDQRRGARAALLLWVGLGGQCRATGTRSHVALVAEEPDDQRDQVGRLRRPDGVHGHACLLRPPAPNSPDRTGPASNLR